ncbi:MAG TPA: TraB/GumN family protein [Steroidobacteraceae bacterium]
MARRFVALLAVLVLGNAHAEPAMWAVAGAKNTVYLFGSVHLLPEGGFTIDGALAEAYHGAEQVCFEVDSSQLDEATTTTITLARAIDPEGRNLFELLGSAADRVRAGAAAAGIDIAPFAPFEPWFAGLAISVMALQEHGYDVEHGVEQIIEASADQDGKARCGLETLDDQLGMLDGMPAELQQELLLQSLDEAGQVDEVIKPMLAAWRAGDERALVRSLEEDFEGYPELAEQLIYARNERWAGLVDDMLDETGDILLVVGALHLVGERGLPALLRERGFEVERR